MTDLLPEPKTTDRKTGLPKAVRHVPRPALPLYPAGGPRPEHPRQGGFDDCWLIAGLSEAAGKAPGVLTDRLREVDGHLVGRLLAPRGGGEREYRFPRRFGGSGAKTDAARGLWVRAWEMLFVYHRAAVNRLDPDYRYTWLDGGFAGELFAALGLPALARTPWGAGAPPGRLAGLVGGPFAAGGLVTVGVVAAGRGSGLTPSHSYSVEAADGDRYTLRNPTGRPAVTVTAAQLAACSGVVCTAGVPAAVEV